MNRKNKINHVLSKLSKFNNSPIKDGIKYQVLGVLYDSIENRPDYCQGCINDDFGYCGLRNSNISDEEIFNKYCCSQMIETLKYELIKK